MAELTEKQQLFLDALCGEAKGNVRKAMDLAGYSKTYSANELTKALKDEITARAELIIAQNSVRAALGLVGILDEPTAMGAQNSIAVAKELLDRTGIVKKDKIEINGELQSAIVIMPAKKRDE